MTAPNGAAVLYLEPSDPSGFLILHAVHPF